MTENTSVNSGSEQLQTFWRSIKGKFFLVFMASFISVFALTLLNFWSMSMVKQRLHLLERYEDLLNDVLEVRRFEKNYLLYNDPSSLVESIDYLQNIELLLDELQDNILEVVGGDEYGKLNALFQEYYGIIASTQAGKSPDQERIRVLGKQLVDSANGLLRKKRERIHKAIVRTSFIPFASLFIFALLVLLIVKIISRGLLQPLSLLKVTTQRVARGDFRPIPPRANRIEEIAGLINAFNRMAQELEANQEDLLQARKIAALGTFTAGIAHELNNPINNISLTAETMEELYADKMDDDAKEMVSDIQTQSERASEIVKNLLDFSRTERPVFTTLTVQNVISSTVNLLKNQFMLTGVTLNKDIPEQLPPIKGNLQNLQQVFMNLMLNAIHAMDNGGRIDIVVREEGAMVRIEIQDTGVGMDQEMLEHIYEPFYTTKEVGKGTGLGLAVTYSIVKRHNGRVEVRSQPGKGTVFSVFLPKMEQ